VRSDATIVHYGRALRRRVLTPDRSATRLAVRGFHEKSPAARELLETVGETFLAGFAHAAEAREPGDAEPFLEAVPVALRGFAYEGAAMALAIVDACAPRSWRVRALLAGRGGDHVYMVYVGVGWAMARLPRPLWIRLHAPDPLLRWLTLDGYGFHQAYFRTDRYVARQERPRWPRGYGARVVDQGIGRALWFGGGADATRVADLVERFAPGRRPDLYAGVGLAATYAGGATGAELRTLLDRAPGHAAQLAQGSAFAAKARTRAGLSTADTTVATEVFCGRSPEAAARITDEALPDPSDDPAAVPTYELWRQRIAAHFTRATEEAGTG